MHRSSTSSSERRAALVVLAAFVLLVGCAELWLRARLFERVSYSNSAAIDEQLAARDRSDRWSILVIGDSEVRWGVHPAEIDAAFGRVGRRTLTFNHAFDGFGGSWWPLLYPRVVAAPALRDVRLVLIGVQMIEVHHHAESVGASPAECGALQRPVITSAMGRDLGLEPLCTARSAWDDELSAALARPLWLTRYRSEVKELAWGRWAAGRGHELALNSARSGEGFSGYEPHRAIAANRSAFEGEFERWKAQYAGGAGRGPLPADAWRRMTAAGGYFDRMLRMVRASGREPVFFALPTNPLAIDFLQRRDTYASNAALLAGWAAARGVVFYDGGIQDGRDPGTFFSDMRHLSDEGAVAWSRGFGEALAREPRLVALLGDTGPPPAMRASPPETSFPQLQEP